MKNLLTESEYIRKAKDLPYYAPRKTWSRWDYMSLVVDEMKILQPSSICEASSEGMYLSDDSTVMELEPKNSGHEEIIHNLNNIPYPIKDKQFDLFIALQVWEHLNNQIEAFEEVKRISHNAILSFPHNWEDDKTHNISMNDIDRWVSNTTPVKIIPIQNRLIYVWSFD